MNSRSFYAILYFVLSCFLAKTNSEYRIFHGANWEIQDSPYVVSINYRDKYNCTGSLITMDLVVSAAHSFKDLSEHYYTVGGGVSDLNDLPEKGEIRYVQDIHIHPDFNFVSLHMDIAVIKLCAPFIECDTIKAIPLCSTRLYSRTPMRVSGWGKYECLNKGPYSSILQSAVFYVFEKDECEEYYNTAWKVVTESMFCAKSLIAATAWGDSGAPGVVNEQLCGVLSIGVTPLDPFYPGIYTNTSNEKVRAFINSVKCNKLEGVQKGSVIYK